jgi:hypothetical protein
VATRTLVDVSPVVAHQRREAPCPFRRVSLWRHAALHPRIVHCDAGGMTLALSAMAKSGESESHGHRPFQAEDGPDLKFLSDRQTPGYQDEDREHHESWNRGPLLEKTDHDEQETAVVGVADPLVGPSSPRCRDPAPATAPAKPRQ